MGTDLGAQQAGGVRPVAFMFPGLGDHYVGMGRDLYRDFPVFRDAVDACATLLRGELGLDIRSVLFPDPDPNSASGSASASVGGGESVDLRSMLGRDEGVCGGNGGLLDGTRLAQPALFVAEYALARLWESWGARPAVMIGYSLGEYVAATLAGVLSLPDALRLVAARAALIDELPAGAMLAVMLGEQELTELLGEGLSLSAVNGPEFCVVAGPVAAVEGLQELLDGRGVVCRRVRSTHAFHSAMMEPVAGPLTELARTLTLNAPRIPYISNVTGEPITDEQATDPGYWARHLLSPVRFATGLRHLADTALLVEAGPGQTLSSMATVVRGRQAGTIVASMRHPLQRTSDSAVALKALGRLWLAGADFDWTQFPAGELDLVADGAAGQLGIDADGAVGESGVIADAAAGPVRDADESVADGGAASEDAGALRAIEQELAGVWARILDNGQLPHDVSFFEIGGNSLLATRLCLRVKRAFGVELSLRQVYEWSTIARMAAAVHRLKTGGELQTQGSSHTGTSLARFTLDNGLTVWHQNEAETRHFYEDIFEHRTYAKHGITLAPGATVVDVGANIGLFTLFAHYEAPDVRVFAFEPAPPMFELLSRNVAEHGVNATLVNIGVSDSDTQATFTFYPRSSGMSSFHPDDAEERHNLSTIIANQHRAHADAEVADLVADEGLLDVRFEAIEFTARLRPLSAVIREQGIERIDLIKIDVQKSERQVIDGIDEQDWPKIQQMVLEVHDADGEVDRLLQLLRGHGFEVLAEQDEMYVGTDIHNIYAVRGTR
ncbi:FkbM family methyltransferase [Streptomyces sp. NPDC004830]